MIVEQRTYTLKPGKVPAYLALYKEEALALQASALGNLIGYFATEIGPLNQVVHLWGYADLADRAQRRATLAAEPAWQAYLAKIIDLIVDMETKILVPADFSPIR